MSAHMFFYKVPGPNEALLITGAGAKVDTKKVAAEESASLGEGAPRVEETQDFKVVTGHGAFVLPVFQRAFILSLDTRRVDLGDDMEHHGGVKCVSSQSIPVIVEAVLIYKVGDDQASIRNAGRRFQDKTPEEVDATVKEMAHGHLRTIIAGLTVEQLITDREALTEQVRNATAADMQKLGLHIDTMQVKEIRDVVSRDGEPGYIESLGKPQAAAVAAQARIAAAQRDQEAAAAEQEAQARKAEASRDAAVRKAAADAETQEAQAKAGQAGPLAQARARQAVVEADTRAAELEASLAEQRLQTEVRKPADAEAYAVAKKAEGDKNAAIARAEAEAQRTRLSAEAESQARRVRAEAEAVATEKTGTAEANATKAKLIAEAEGAKEKGLAEAAGIEARQKALSENAEGVIAQQVAEQLPAIVAAAAQQWNNVDNLTVFDGADGMGRGLLATVSTAKAIMPLAGELFAATKGIADKAAATDNGSASGPGRGVGRP
jgi:flotillin